MLLAESTRLLISRHQYNLHCIANSPRTTLRGEQAKGFIRCINRASQLVCEIMIPNLLHWSITLFCLAQIQPKIHMRIHVLLGRVGFTQNVPYLHYWGCYSQPLREILHTRHMTDVFYLKLISQHLLFEDIVKCSSFCPGSSCVLSSEFTDDRSTIILFHRPSDD